MKKLLYKEFNLSIHKAFFLVPLLTGALFMIPQWPYFIALMYFFFISAPNILSSYNAKRDYTFTIMMPVAKKDIVTSKILAFMILETTHLIFGIIFAILHNAVYRTPNFMLDPNAAFFGLSFIMFGLFNLLMFPMYFRTANNFGFPVTISCIITIFYAFGVEMLVIFNKAAAEILEGREPGNIAVQYGILAAGIIIFLAASYISIRISAKRFAQVNL